MSKAWPAAIDRAVSLPAGSKKIPTDSSGRSTAARPPSSEQPAVSAVSAANTASATRAAGGSVAAVIFPERVFRRSMRILRYRTRFAAPCFPSRIPDTKYCGQGG